MEPATPAIHNCKREGGELRDIRRGDKLGLGPDCVSKKSYFVCVPQRGDGRRDKLESSILSWCGFSWWMLILLLLNLQRIAILVGSGWHKPLISWQLGLRDEGLSAVGVNSICCCGCGCCCCASRAVWRHSKLKVKSAGEIYK